MEITATTTLEQVLRAELTARGFAESAGYPTEDRTQWTLGGITDEYGNVSDELASVEATYWPECGNPDPHIEIVFHTDDTAYGVSIDRTTPALVAQAILRTTLDGGLVATPVVVEAAQAVVDFARPIADADAGRRDTSSHVTTLMSWLEQPSLPKVQPEQWLLGPDWCVARYATDTGQLLEVSEPMSHPAAVQAQQALTVTVGAEVVLRMVRVDQLAAEILDPTAADEPAPH